MDALQFGTVVCETTPRYPIGARGYTTHVE